MAEKKTITEAARELGIHPNTIKNWQKAGKLPSAEKIRKPGGGYTWIVDVDETTNVAQHGGGVYEVPSVSRGQRFDTDPQPPGGQQSTDNQPPADTGAATILMRLQDERESLLEKVWSLEAQLQDATLERGRVGELERQIERLEVGAGRSARLISLLILALVALAAVALIAVVLLALFLK